MKAGTQNHLKVKRLMRLLGVPMYRAVGILESIWLLCADCCDEGNIGKFTDEEIADYIGWDGPDASGLVRTLADAGWLDPDSDSRFVVHDWADHCPEYIRDRIRKRDSRDAKRRKQTTYVASKPDTGGTTPDKTGQPPDAPGFVPSIPNQSQPNPTNPIADVDKPRTQKFQKPTIEEIRAFCIARGNRVDPEKFFHHYESNGWRVGRNPMRSWQASIVTWEKSDLNKPAPAKSEEPYYPPMPPRRNRGDA